MPQSKITSDDAVIDATRDVGTPEMLKPIELVLRIPRTTYKVLQWAAKIDRARDLQDWILLSAWQRAVRVREEYEAIFGLVHMHSGQVFFDSNPNSEVAERSAGSPTE